MNTVRVALPGYDALTDTNLDHFSLYADTDNVLIKRALTGSGTIPASTGPAQTVTIPHNLGYIPFFAVYTNYTDIMGNTWKVLNNQFNGFSVPSMVCSCDTSNLYISNYDAAAYPYAYDIFYDDMSQTGTPSITESKEVFKVARPGKSALSKNPNDYIMHSDLNNLKIIKQTKTTVSLSSGINNVAHGAILITPYKIMCFVKFPDGKTALAGNAATYSYDETKWVEVSYTSSNIVIYSSGSFSVDITYIIFGTATTGSITNTGLGPLITVAASGYDAVTDTNVEHYNFHSHFSTLKYYSSNVWDMGTITAGTVKTIAHNLGYVPFFIGFINDIAAVTYAATNYCIAPYLYGRSGITPNNDIGMFMYADATNIYLKAYYQTNASGTSISPKWYYKLFKNNLGL